MNHWKQITDDDRQAWEHIPSGERFYMTWDTLSQIAAQLQIDLNNNISPLDMQHLVTEADSISTAEDLKKKLREVLVNAGHLPSIEPDLEKFPHIESMLNYLTYSVGGEAETVFYRSSHMIQMLAEIQMASISIDNPIVFYF